MPQNYLRNKILLELLWWLFTLFIILIIYFPIYLNGIKFPFFYYNLFFIISSITFIRLIFQMKFSFMAHNLVLKFLLMFGSVVVLMLAYRGIGLYNIFKDENGFYSLFEHLSLEKRYTMAAYVNWQYFFFGVAAMVSAIVMPFRLLISIFRVRNIGAE